MPTIHSFELPRPKNWQDFEKLVLEAQRLRWNSPMLQPNGRPGQVQHGVDIYGPDDIGRRVGIQCKRSKPALNVKIVSAEIANAEKFKGPLSTLFIATTNDHDANLQQEVRLLSDKRVSSDEFAVGILFWDDIVTGLALNPFVVKSFYPQIQLAIPAEANRERLLGALELGYYGPYLWKFVELTFSDIGVMAGTNPDLINILLRTIEQRAGQLLSPTDTASILAFAGQVRSGCYSDSEALSEGKVKDYAERIADRVKLASSLLPITESNVLETGITLGHIYHNVDDRPSKTLRDDLRQRLRTILPESYQHVVDQRFKAAAKVKSGYRWTPPIYACLERGIRWAML